MEKFRAVESFVNGKNVWTAQVLVRDKEKPFYYYDIKSSPMFDNPIAAINWAISFWDSI